MWERGLVILLLATSLLLAGMALVQVGCGPYSVVYGPASALRAQRAFLSLTLVCMALGALAAVAQGFAFARAAGPARPAVNSDSSFGFPALVSMLRC